MTSFKDQVCVFYWIIRYPDSRKRVESREPLATLAVLTFIVESKRTLIKDDDLTCLVTVIRMMMCQNTFILWTTSKSFIRIAIE